MVSGTTLVTIRPSPVNSL